MKTKLKHTHYAKSHGTAARHGKHGKRPRFGLISAVRFRETRLSCLLSIPAAADALGVSQRTIANWETGRSRAPYAAFRLLRILFHYELPDPAWEGYTLHRGTLWSPEGLAFRPHEQRWWSLTCAMAREFRSIVQERRQAASSCTAAEPVLRSIHAQSEPVATEDCRNVVNLSTLPVPFHRHAPAIRPDWQASAPVGPNSNTGQKSPPILRSSAGGAP